MAKAGGGGKRLTLGEGSGIHVSGLLGLGSFSGAAVHSSGLGDRHFLPSLVLRGSQRRRKLVIVECA